jgi:tetratricopeptide (TPR) repeat protein
MENFELAKSFFFEGLAHLEREEYAQAASRLRESLDLVPDRLSTLINLSVALLKLEKLQAAREISIKALALDERLPEAWLNLGLVELQEESPLPAIDCFDKAIACEAAFAEAWMNKGIALRQLGRHQEALSSAGHATGLRADYAVAWLNRGLVELDLGLAEEALASFERAIAIKPDWAEAHCNRGLALRELNKSSEALASFHRATALKPDLRAAQYHVFALHMSELADEKLIARLGEELAARQLQSEIDRLHRDKVMSDCRVLHELEQTSYLLAVGHGGGGLREANARLREIYADYVATEGHSVTTKQIHLSDAAIADLVEYGKNPPRYRVLVPGGGCLNPDMDWSAVEAQYFGSMPEMIVIDDFLSAEALAELRRFCLLSAVWKKNYRGQYLGAFPDDGFVGPLQLRIALELRRKMPRIFGPHRFEQLWAFKYTSRLGGGINVHADFAKINLNFWITPDEANLDPESGGLVVYDVPCPSSWGFRKYNRDEKAIYDLLGERRAVATRVPYRCNRAVLFNSNLFHETDKIRFRDGYENRRINITYLFGKGLITT